MGINQLQCQKEEEGHEEAMISGPWMEMGSLAALDGRWIIGGHVECVEEDFLNSHVVELKNYAVKQQVV